MRKSKEQIKWEADARQNVKDVFALQSAKYVIVGEFTDDWEQARLLHERNRMTNTIKLTVSKERVEIMIPSAHYQDQDTYAVLTHTQAIELAGEIRNALEAYALGGNLVDSVTKTLRWTEKGAK
jgi:hypothetical protein